MTNENEVAPLVFGKIPDFDIIKAEVIEKLAALCTDQIQYELIELRKSGLIYFKKSENDETTNMVTQWRYTDYGLTIDINLARALVSTK